MTIVGAAVAIVTPPTQIAGATPVPWHTRSAGLTRMLRPRTALARQTAAIVALAMAAATAVVAPAHAVAPAPFATSVSVQTSNDSHPTVGNPIDSQVIVNAPSAPPGTWPTGSIKVWHGSNLLDTVALYEGQLLYYPIPTHALPVGAVQLRFEYVPDSAAYATSEAFHNTTMYAAVPSIRVGNTAPAPITWGETHAITMTVTSGLAGTYSVEVQEHVNAVFTTIATVPVVVANGTGTSTVDLTRKLPAGDRQYRLQVLAGAKSTAVETDYFSIRIAEAPTAISLTATDSAGVANTGHRAQRLTVSATVTSAPTQRQRRTRQR